MNVKTRKIISVVLGLTGLFAFIATLLFKSVDAISGFESALWATMSCVLIFGSVCVGKTNG